MSFEKYYLNNKLSIYEKKLKMGVNCCSHAKESQDITIIKPEKSMTSPSQNPLIKTEKRDQLSFIQNKNNIISSEVINTNSQKNLNQPLDGNNNLYPSNENSGFPLSEKEIDDLLNNINTNNYQANPQQQVINTNVNNNSIKTEQNMLENKNNLVQNSRPNNQILNIPQNIQSNHNIQNQNINKINNPIQKEAIQINQNKNPQINYINNNNNNTNNDKYIEDLLKNTSSGQNIHTNSNINLDVFFDQNDNIKIDDALIDKLFESAGKPIFKSTPPPNNINNINGNEPLYLSQKMNHNPPYQIKAGNNNNYFSPVN